MWGRVSNAWKGGGEGSVHSSVVALWFPFVHLNLAGSNPSANTFFDPKKPILPELLFRYHGLPAAY